MGAQTFQKELDKKRESVKPPGGSRSRSSSSAPSAQYKNNAGKAILRRAFAESSISQNEAQLLFPTPVRVYEDRANGRWQCHWPGLCSRSRHFQLHGHVNGLRQLMQWAWRERLERDGVALTSCPVEGLFPQSGVAGPSSG